MNNASSSLPVKIPSLLPLVVITLFISLVLTATASADDNIGLTVVDQFVSRTGPWWNKLRDYAFYVFKVTASLEICLFGIRMVLQKSQINEIAGQFAMMMLFICFIAAVIMNYKEWATAIAITGLDTVVTDLGGGAAAFDAGSPVSMIFKCLDSMVPVLGNAGIRDIGMTMIYVFCMGSVAVVFAVICCRYILVVCEFYIVANAGVLLIGLGGSKIFKEYAFNAMKYVLSVAVKLFVLQLVCNVGFGILSLTTEIGDLGTSIKNISLVTLLMIVVQGIILLGLAQVLPSTCAGIINGASLDGGNPLMMMAGKVGGKAMSMVGNAGKSLAGGVQNLRTANQIATADGAKGLGRISHVRGSLKQAGMNANPNSMQTQLTSQLNSSKAMAKLNDDKAKGNKAA